MYMLGAALQCDCLNQTCVSWWLSIAYHQVRTTRTHSLSFHGSGQYGVTSSVDVDIFWPEEHCLTKCPGFKQLRHACFAYHTAILDLGGYIKDPSGLLVKGHHWVFQLYMHSVSMPHAWISTNTSSNENGSTSLWSQLHFCHSRIVIWFILASRIAMTRDPNESCCTTFSAQRCWLATLWNCMAELFAIAICQQQEVQKAQIWVQWIRHGLSQHCLRQLVASL